MKHALKARAFSFLTASFLALTALPALATADVCEKINFTAQNTIYEQVTKQVRNKDTVTAKDAACIVKNISDRNTQEKVGIYLAKRLENPNKLDTLLDAVNDRYVRNNIESAVNTNNDRHNSHNAWGEHGSNNNVLTNICKRINFDNHYKDSPYVQVKNIVNDSKTVQSSDVACIFQRVSRSQQEKIGLYLASHIADPESAYLFLNKVENDKVRSKIQNEINNYYNSHNNSNVYDHYFMGDLCGRINYSKNYHVSPYVQIKDLVKDNTTVLSSDIACIFDKVSKSQQEKIGLYLASHLEDPQNADVFLNKINNKKDRTKIKKTINQYYGSNPSYNDHGHDHNSYPYQPEPNNKPTPSYPPVQGNPYPPAYGQPQFPSQQPPYDPQFYVAQNIADKIDYTFSSKVLQQVKLYLGNKYIYASDAATIIKKTSSRQDEIALYLIERIADYDNVDLVVKSLTFKSGREKVINAAISFITSHPNDPRFAPKNVNNISSKIDFTFGSEVMPQLRLYLRYNLIYSDDAAQIVRKTSSHQGEVGQYLATRLADPNNINILIDAVTFRSDKDAIIKAALNAQQ